MTISQSMPVENEAGAQMQPSVMQQMATDGDQLAIEQRLHDESEFIRLSRRHAYLARSFTAEHQRERASLQGTLMKLYTTLHPKSVYKWDDDFDVVMRAERHV